MRKPRARDCPWLYLFIHYIIYIRCGGLHSTYPHDACLEVVVLNERLVLYARLVSVYRVHRILQELRYAFAFRYSKTYQGEDAHLGCKRHLLLRYLALVLREHTVVLFHEVREYLQECRVEHSEHIVALFVKYRLLERVAQVVVLACLYLAVYHAVELLHLVDKLRIDVE